MRTLGFVLVFSVSLAAQAAAPSQALLRDARDELAAAVKALEASSEYQRVQRMTRVVNELAALAKAVEKKSEPPPPANGSK